MTMTEMLKIHAEIEAANRKHLDEWRSCSEASHTSRTSKATKIFPQICSKLAICYCK